MSKASSRSSTSTRKRTQASFGSRTDIGCVRKHNEDSLVVEPPLFAVADGMGGHAAGEVASEIAMNTLIDNAPRHADAEALGRAVESANREVMAAAHDGRGRDGMGTTMTAAILEGERLIIAQVGDSRAYLLHADRLQQLTRDHSLMADMIEAGQLTEEEARTHPNRSVITRALGSDEAMRPDLYEINVESGDRLLLCSDGLSSMITDDEIEESLVNVSDAQRCANTLVNKAIAAGGHDNVTVIVSDIEGSAPIKERRAARKVKAWVVVVILAFLLIAGAAVGGFNYYASHSVYLSNDNGRVAVYRGIPGALFGFQMSELDHVTDVEVSSLQPGVASRLDEGIRVDTLDAAEELVEQYREDAKRSATPSGNGNSSDSDTSNDSQRDTGTRSNGSTESAGSESGTGNEGASSGTQTGEGATESGATR